MEILSSRHFDINEIISRFEGTRNGFLNCVKLTGLDFSGYKRVSLRCPGDILLRIIALRDASIFAEEEDGEAEIMAEEANAMLFILRSERTK